MKLNKLTKSLIAGVALTTAGFANAGAIATADLTVQNFAVLETVDFSSIFELQDAINSATLAEGIEVQVNDFDGSAATAEDISDGVVLGTDYVLNSPDPQNFTLEAMSDNAYALVDFNGLATTEGGAAGRTYASAAASGSESAIYAQGNLENTATFRYEGTDADDDNEQTTVMLAWQFAYDLFVDVFDMGGTAEASVSFNVQFREAGTTDTISSSSFESIVTSNGSLSKTETAGQGLLYETDSSNIFFASPVTLTEGTDYVLTVFQYSDVDVKSVSEPASLAAFGLGLLGLAGAARRRKA
jgi:hypothetical protein